MIRLQPHSHTNTWSCMSPNTSVVQHAMMPHVHALTGGTAILGKCYHCKCYHCSCTVADISYSGSINIHSVGAKTREWKLQHHHSWGNDSDDMKKNTVYFLLLLKCSLSSVGQIHYLQYLLTGFACQECLLNIWYLIFIDYQWLLSDQNQIRIQQVWNLHYTIAAQPWHHSL